MLSFQHHLKVFVALEPCDMRKSYDGLYNAATQQLGLDPREGALFVFGNRNRDRIKILYFDGTGVCVLAKRLEKGRFSWPRSSGSDSKKLRLAPEALQLLIDGVDLKGARLKPWYER